MAITSFTGFYSFLSNFFAVRVTLDAHEYPSVENAYQAAKTLHYARRIELQTCSAAQAKRIGRSLPLRADWEQIKEQVMLDLLRQKFTHPSLALRLLETGDQDLVEGNYWGDTYWGVCRGVGKNRLGMLLMQVRSELAKSDLEQ